ncbi:hypothetical protein vseg_000220 [Gypsophila vaccaria]
MMTTHEIDFLKETLSAQQELLQKLLNELDAERESSAVAADETLSMILRLQGERAALEMEARQYKRMAEEKICHAHEMVEIFQELVYQKELQIASLEFQVQAYKFRLAVLGFVDCASCEVDYSDKMSLRRGNSLPSAVNIASSRRSSTEATRTGASSPKTSRRLSTTAGDVNLYWEEIKKLDEKVKGVIGLHPSESTSSPDNSSDETEKVLDVGTCGESQCSTSVHDIFEVPTYGVSDIDLDQFNKRLKQLEIERFVTGDEELELLRKIMKKVEAMQSEVTYWRTKKPPSPGDRSFGCFKEVFSCFLP